MAACTRSLLSALTATLAAACATPPAADVRLDARELELGAAFPAPAALLRGFDARDADAAWCAGDEVLFGLRLRREAEVRHWLLRLRLSEPEALADGAALAPVDWSIRINGAPQHFASRACRAHVTVMDERGRVLGESDPVLPRDFLAHGLAGACRRIAARLAGVRGPFVMQDVYRDTDVRPLAEATVSAVALLQVVQEDDVLAPLLWQVVQRPSLWSVLRNLGAKVVLRPRFHALVETTSSLAAAPGAVYRLPLVLLVNDAPALQVELFVGEAAPPFALCGGVLGAIARHPTEPGVELSLQLLSARRGTAAPTARGVGSPLREGGGVLLSTHAGDQLSRANGRDTALDSR